jgi:hypothetical protein
MIKPCVKVGWKNGKLLVILRLRLWAVENGREDTLQVGIVLAMSDYIMR